jgi:hypothetical protein
VDPRLIARMLAGARIALGLALFLAPSRTGRGWLGAGQVTPGTSVVVRGVGARDVALGVGTMVALRDDDRPRDAHRWLEASIVADLADATAIGMLGRPDRRRGGVLALALGAAAVGGLARKALH